jgi:hypothetical protein
MVDVDINPMPSKIIRRHVCLQVKGPSKLSKDPGPKRHINILWKVESKKIRDSMKVENGVVHCKK